MNFKCDCLSINGVVFELFHFIFIFIVKEAYLFEGFTVFGLFQFEYDCIVVAEVKLDQRLFNFDDLEPKEVG